MGKSKKWHYISTRRLFVKELYWCGWSRNLLAAWAIPYPLAGIYDLLQGQDYLPSNWDVLSILIPQWVSRSWLFLGVILFIFITIEGAYRIVYKNRSEQNRAMLEIIGGVNNDIFSGTELLNKLRHSDTGLDKYLEKEYSDWYGRVAGAMQREQYSELHPFIRFANVGNGATLYEYKKACEDGLDYLVNLQKRLTNSSVSRKGGSPKQ